MSEPVHPSIHPLDPADRERVEQTRRRASELERAEADRPIQPATPETNIPGVQILRSVLASTVFTDLFCHQAHARYLYPRAEERVAAMIEAHPRFYKYCRGADLVARGLVFLCVVGVLTFAAIATVIKTLLA